MAYAIIETGGKQLRVEPGRFYDIELLAAEPDSDYQIDRVLLIHNEDEINVGQPFIQGATVEGKILQHRRGRKVLVYKMKPKKKTRKKRGHRQEITRFLVNSITFNGNVITTPETIKDTAPTPVESPVEA
jgi:large subunit ribosomal protein L21